MDKKPKQTKKSKKQSTQDEKGQGEPNILKVEKSGTGNKVFFKTLVLVANVANTKGCEAFWKLPKPCHDGFHN